MAITIPDLHQLANQRGYGQAQKILKNCGAWDDYAGMPYETFRLKVEFSVHETEVMTVKARCLDEAEERAQEILEERFDCDVDVIDCEVTE